MLERVLDCAWHARDKGKPFVFLLHSFGMPQAPQNPLMQASCALKLFWFDFDFLCFTFIVYHKLKQPGTEKMKENNNPCQPNLI